VDHECVGGRNEFREALPELPRQIGLA
jgi:hypothetical protein